MKKKEYLVLSITVFLTVLAWLIADVYHAATEEKLKNRANLPNIRNYQIDNGILEILRQKQE